MDRKLFVIRNNLGVLGIYSNRKKSWAKIEEELGENDVYSDYSKGKTLNYVSLSRRLMLEKSVNLVNPYGEQVTIEKHILNK